MWPEKKGLRIIEKESQKTTMKLSIKKLAQQKILKIKIYQMRLIAEVTYYCMMAGFQEGSKIKISQMMRTMDWN